MSDVSNDKGAGVSDQTGALGVADVRHVTGAAHGGSDRSYVVTYGMVHAGNRNTLHAVYDIVECSAGRTDRVLAHDVRYADATHIVEALNMLALAHITAE